MTTTFDVHHDADARIEIEETPAGRKLVILSGHGTNRFAITQSDAYRVAITLSDAQFDALANAIWASDVDRHAPQCDDDADVVLIGEPPPF